MIYKLSMYSGWWKTMIVKETAHDPVEGDKEKIKDQISSRNEK